jgi:hypothetical protein
MSGGYNSKSKLNATIAHEEVTLVVGHKPLSPVTLIMTLSSSKESFRALAYQGYLLSSDMLKHRND